MWTVLMIAVGIIIGWQLPQPEWAKKIQADATTWVRYFFAKPTGKE